MASKFLEFWKVSESLEKAKIEAAPLFAYSAFDKEKFFSSVESLFEVDLSTLGLPLSSSPARKLLGVENNHVHAFFEVEEDKIFVEFSTGGKRLKQHFSALKGLDSGRVEGFSAAFRIDVRGEYVLLATPSLEILSFYKDPSITEKFLSLLGLTLGNIMLPHRDDYLVESLIEGFKEPVLFALDDVVENLAFPLSRQSHVRFLNASLLGISVGPSEVHSAVHDYTHKLTGHFQLEGLVRNLAWLAVDSFMHGLSWFGLDELSPYEGVIYRVGRFPGPNTPFSLISDMALLQFIPPSEDSADEFRSLFLEEVRRCCEELSSLGVDRSRLEELELLTA